MFRMSSRSAGVRLLLFIFCRSYSRSVVAVVAVADWPLTPLPPPTPPSRGVSRPHSLGGGVSVVVVLDVSYISSSRSLAKSLTVSGVRARRSSRGWAGACAASCDECDRLIVSVFVFTK
uniref:Putative secreted peptide n=1 Tax=Anopheles braziliensis TaxID=58242 RepID=A0A2M3ZMX4_9DIPT